MKGIPEDDSRKLKQLQDVPLLHATIFTDGGPWAMHNMPCPIHCDKKAVLDVGSGIFYPSHQAVMEGWVLAKVPPWLKWLIEKFQTK